MVAERVFLSYSEKIKIYNIRPATVCGFSPRMRLDVSVNMLTFQALRNKKITVFGGSQIRPNVHINDMVNIYKFFIDNNPKSGNYNAGFENISILEIAKLVQKVIPSEIIVTQSNDPRSYRQDSSKLLNIGFQPRFGVKDAIEEIKEMFDLGKLEDKENYYTVKWMKKLELENKNKMPDNFKKKLYSEMLRIRCVEEKIAERYPEGKMRCPTHLSIGQEAVPVAVSCVLNKKDFAVSTHRGHAHYLAKGGSLKKMIDEIHGKESGCSKGKGDQCT